MDNVPHDTGYLAEILFEAEARKNGFEVLVSLAPLPFDRVVWKPGNKFLKIQIKSCRGKDKTRDRYGFRTTRSLDRYSYTKEQVDFFAFYIFDTNDWFIVPFEEIGGMKVLKLTPTSPFQKFKNKFDLLDIKDANQQPS